jgi:DNA-binding NarL/FixJ family response regulator
MTSFVLADDHPMVRHGLKTVLEAEEDWRVVGEAANGAEVQDLLTTLEPDILVLDVMMPGLNGIEVTNQLRETAITTRVIIFSMYASDSYVRAAMNNGAFAYVLKDSDGSEIIHAVREVIDGRRYLSRSLTERAINLYLQQPSDSSLDWYEMLTARERQVIQLAAQGSNNTEIGNRLSISPRTAETHRTNIMRKLGLRSQADLIAYALKHGIIPSPTP